MTEHERALSGRLFAPRCRELKEIKHKAHSICQKFNMLDEWDEERKDLTDRLLGSHGERVVFQGPIQFNYGCNTHIGNEFFANFNFTVLDDNTVNIGDNVLIGPNVSIMAANHPLYAKQREEMTYPDDHVSISEYAKPVNIGSHVWIGCGSVICDGVTIGDGAVIGAGSVVTKDIPSGWLAYGVPCVPVREITENDRKEDLM